MCITGGGRQYTVGSRHINRVYGVQWSSSRGCICRILAEYDRLNLSLVLIQQDLTFLISGPTWVMHIPQETWRLVLILIVRHVLSCGVKDIPPGRWRNDTCLTYLP